jgi:hypothetical protein
MLVENPVTLVLNCKLLLVNPYWTIKVLSPANGPQLTKIVLASSLFSSIMVGMVVTPEDTQGGGTPGGLGPDGGGLLGGFVGLGPGVVDGTGVSVGLGVSVGVGTGAVVGQPVLQGGGGQPV